MLGSSLKKNLTKSYIDFFQPAADRRGNKKDPDWFSPLLIFDFEGTGSVQNGIYSLFELQKTGRKIL